MADDDIPFERNFDPKPDEVQQVSPLIRRVLAPNPGPFTFTGTCTYIIGRGEVAILDPGPDNANHVAALIDATKGERVSHIVITHTHRDHAPASRALQQATGAAIVGCRPYQPRHADAKSSGLDFGARYRLPPGTHSRRRRDARRSELHLGSDRHARPCIEPSRLRAMRRERALLWRSRHGLVDVDRRAARRLDERLHGIAGETARPSGVNLLARSRRAGARAAALSPRTHSSSASARGRDPHAHQCR